MDTNRCYFTGQPCTDTCACMNCQTWQGSQLAAERVTSLRDAIYVGAPITPQSGLVDQTPHLTPSQTRTLQLMSEGCTLLRAAQTLGISRNAVRNRMVVIKDILDAETTAEACCVGLRKGLIK